MEADIVKPGHAWIISKLVDKRSGSVTVKDLIYNLCESALPYVKTEDNLISILTELDNCGHIKKPTYDMFTAAGLMPRENRYEITEKGIIAFRVQIMAPIIKARSENSKIAERFNVIKTLQRNKTDVMEDIITLCLQHAALIVEFIKYVNNS